ncbi:MAG: TonB-dependent receptor [Saprospiraceae bacterium]
MLLFLISSALSAQITQTIRGTVLDKDVKMPLIGAAIAVMTTEPIAGTSTDIDGYFKLENITVGRHDLQITYLGYDPIVMNNIMISSGKELVLNIELQEMANQLNEVVVSAAKQVDKTKPLNELATVSARTFSIEETSRYASSNFDPARMAQNYAGVSVGSGDDLFNEIVIRGNSPSGVMWRLEGIQIPNPNHFGAMGNSGGAISMLSSTTLSNSDFYTGAFPSEFGNALSGVFDLNMRNGNNEKREYSLMLGALGIELAAEGPFSSQSKASYLVNYRYSTLAALAAIGLNPAGDVLPAYQDVSFKVNVPTAKAGTFSLFGLGGSNIAEYIPERDSTTWQFEGDEYGFAETQRMGTIGLSHRILLSDRSYLRTVMVASHENVKEDEYFLDTQKDYAEVMEYRDDITTNTYRFSSTYNHKFSPQHTLRAGVVASHFDFGFQNEERDYEQEKLVQLFDNQGSTQLVQSFAHWQYRINNELTLNTGLHYTHLLLNDENAFEPRAALQWKVNPKSTLSLAAGLHSKMEHLGIYLFEGEIPNGPTIQAKDNLGLTKAFHGVLGYDWIFAPNMRLKAEAYYQRLYNVPVSTEPTSTYSIINAVDVWDVIGLPSAVNEGTGENVGLDLTIEKFFTNQYYFMATGSVFNSTYTPQDGNTYSTRFNGNYQLNLLGGKEFNIGKKGNKTLGINGKFVISGGNRYTPFDLEQSRVEGYGVRDLTQRFAGRTPAYYRFDLGLNYKINTKRMTHTIMIDVQNLTNRQNVFSLYYNRNSQELDQYTQTGLFPTFNYRVEF